MLVDYSFRISSVFTVLAVVYCSPLWADGNPNSTKYLMAGVGDSMTTAFLSDISASETDTQDKAKFFTPESFKDLLQKEEGSNQYTFSWSTGSDVASQFKRLEAWLQKNEPGMTLERKNFSIIAGKSETLPGQMEKVLAEMATGQYKALKLITISMGGNDLCVANGGSETGTDPAVYVAQIRESLATLAKIKQSEPIRVFYTGLPNIPGLGRDEILETRTVLNMTCNQFRAKIHNSCVNLLNFQNPVEHDQALEKVIGMNNLLRKTVEEAALEHKNLEIVFSLRFFETTVKREWLAADCFHPNREGQEELARINWEDQTWFK